KCIAHSYILHSEVRHIQQVTRLRLEVGRIYLLSRISRSWVISIGILGGPVIELVVEPAFSRSVARDEYRPVGPHFAFSNSLHKYAQVKAFPVSTQLDPVLVSWS